MIDGNLMRKVKEAYDNYQKASADYEKYCNRNNGTAQDWNDSRERLRQNTLALKATMAEVRQQLNLGHRKKDTAKLATWVYRNLGIRGQLEKRHYLATNNN